jgi:hypothetical protein
MTPDPKRPARLVDKTARIRKLLIDPRCRACGVEAVNTHHLIGKGQGGDDVCDNLIPLCGSGSHGCHGALHGNPYVNAAGERVTGQVVRYAIGLTLWPSEYTYVITKLSPPAAPSPEPGAQFLRDQYGVEIDTPRPFRMRAVSSSGV